MTRTSLMVLGLVILAVGKSCAEEQAGGLIKTLGSARVYAMPDTARVTFMVDSQDEQLQAARQRTAAKCGGIVAALRALNTKGLSLSTESINIEPLIEDPGRATNDGFGGPPDSGYYGGMQVVTKVVAYRVTSSVRVSINAPTEHLGGQTAAAIDAALLSGATRLYSPRFSKSDTSAEAQEALEKATKDGVAKAQAIARGLGVEIARYNYAGMFPRTPVDDRGMAYLSAGEDGTVVEVAAIPVEAFVYVEATY